ncbi:MAG: DUF2807 domain-containing protein [Chloroflexi bacterium]|nr:DUF2807 domain-containing protein [Chloroflexota bacterium]
MNKKPPILVFLLIAFVIGGCGFNINIDVERGSGNVITEERDVSNFDRLDLIGIGDVILTQGDREELRIEAEDNLIPLIKTEVRNGTLHIGLTRRSVIPTEPVRFYLTMRDIRGLKTSGVSNLNAGIIETDQLDVAISGTGNMDIDELTVDKLTISVSGAGNFSAEGSADSQTVILSGAGNYDGEDLESQEADVTISGFGKVTVWVTSRLDVRISGSGSVDYYGSPQLEQQITGLGEIRRLGDK